MEALVHHHYGTTLERAGWEEFTTLYARCLFIEEYRAELVAAKFSDVMAKIFGAKKE